MQLLCFNHGEVPVPDVLHLHHGVGVGLGGVRLRHCAASEMRFCRRLESGGNERVLYFVKGSVGNWEILLDSGREIWGSWLHLTALVVPGAEITEPIAEVCNIAAFM